MVALSVVIFVICFVYTKIAKATNFYVFYTSLLREKTRVRFTICGLEAERNGSLLFDLPPQCPRTEGVLLL